MSQSIADNEMKALIAFPGCSKRLRETGNADDNAAFLGEMANIIADSRHGPRGISPMSDEDRDKHTNLVLLCCEHTRSSTPSHGPTVYPSCAGSRRTTRTDSPG